MDTVPCLHCVDCGISWPHIHAYHDCGVCGAKTSPITGFPISLDKARSLKVHADFDRFYADREAALLRAELDTLAA